MRMLFKVHLFGRWLDTEHTNNNENDNDYK